MSVLLAGLCGYLAFSLAQGKENDFVCGIASTICFLGTLIPCMGLKHESASINANIRVLSGTFFFIFLVSHILFAIFGIRMPFYVIINGILLVVFMAFLYKLQSIKNI